MNINTSSRLSSPSQPRKIASSPLTQSEGGLVPAPPLLKTNMTGILEDENESNLQGSDSSVSSASKNKSICVEIVDKDSLNE